MSTNKRLREFQSFCRENRIDVAVLSRKGHLKLKLERDGLSRIVTMASSPSDFLADRNLYKAVERAFRCQTAQT